MHVADILNSEPGIALKARKLLADPDTDFPLFSAKIKLTRRCNLRCKFCSIWVRTPQPVQPDLEYKRIKTVLSELESKGLRKIHYSGGELLLHRQFAEIIRFSRSLGLQVNITTNGTLLNKQIARFLVEQRIHAVTVSIDSHDNKQHDCMRGEKGAWQRAWQGIDNLVRRKQKKGRGPIVGINTLLTRQNVDKLDDLFQLLVSKGAERWRLLPLDTEKKKFRLTSDQWQTLSGQWSGWQTHLTRLPVDWSNSKSSRKVCEGKYAGSFYHDRVCFAPWFNVFINSDGNVYPCCMGKGDMMPYGNIRKNPISVILSGDRHKEICCSMAKGQIFPVCENCDDFLEENLAFNNLYHMEEKSC